jgi:solute carrier family 25 (mitochondrial iron transporter), member 28/37
MISTMGIGAATTFAHDFFITPSDVIKQRLQLCKKLTATQCIKDILREEGFRGLYRSYPITVFMNLPFSSMVVCVNENLKTLFRPWEQSNPHLWYFICAGIAGGFAGVITNPLDVVKTRL